MVAAILPVSSCGVLVCGLFLAELAVAHNSAWEVQTIQKETDLRTIHYFNIFISTYGRKPLLLSTDYLLPLSLPSTMTATTFSQGSNRLLPSGID